MLSKRVALVLGILLAGSVQADRDKPDEAALLKKAEAFIDAFYSFESQKLAPLLEYANTSADSILYYQAWAEGGNYKVKNRRECQFTDQGTVKCPITVEDDLVLALKTGFLVTDTFEITFVNSEIQKIETSSDDQPIYYEARDWVKVNRPEIMQTVCNEMWKNVENAGDCVRAMHQGYKAYFNSIEKSGGG
jgi:hypothetical protein